MVMREAMMTPGSEAEVAQIVKAAREPLAVMGGGTRGLEPDGAALSVARLSGITLYEPGALTLVAQAGTPLAQVESVLAAERQRLAFEPMDHRAVLGTRGEPTLGGVIAGNISGPRRIQSGAARDHALGVRFVDGAGNVVKNGGRVMKNVTGYDLVKLMCGSFGTLGVLTEISLKVLPIPETEATLVLRGFDDGAAVRAMATAMRSPFEVTGAAHLPKGAEGQSETLLRIEGFEASVDYRIGRLKALLGGTGAHIDTADAERSGELWRSVRDVAPFHGTGGDVWRVSCKPSEGPELAARSGARDWFFDWAGGLIWFCLAEGSDLRAALGRFDGHATLVRAAPETRRALPVFQPQANGVAMLSAGLRARFDPRGVLNRGLMGPT